MTDSSTRLRADLQIKSAVPTFWVPDVAGTARWYAEHLGFRIAGTVPKQEPYAYVSLQRDAAEIMLLSLPGYKRPDLSARRPQGLWDAYIRMKGVHALYDAVRNAPFVQMPLKHQPYGDWEFEVRDPNGYVLVFGGE
ncbi:MAG TPA: VOC family protein [Gemmatimonadales bacterium]|nr:VOC family protein [Gemmatimonadales bacterium]